MSLILPRIFIRKGNFKPSQSRKTGKNHEFFPIRYKNDVFAIKIRKSL
jgi:hypothetical protein